jgi:DNA polymerase-3 subunit delta'
MSISHYLQQFQPHIHHLFSHALTQKKWSHAYLLSGQKGTPLKEIAIYLAKSLVCEHGQPLADDTCQTCRRIDAGDFVDLHVIDGQEASIKKQDILNLEQSFSVTSLEIFQRQIYILHLVETMTPEAVNALLKFLEEPQQDIYAILTTESVHSLLPTILSRSQVVTLKPIEQSRLVDLYQQAGLNEDDAQLASFFYTTPELAKAWVSTSSYVALKKATMEWLSLMGQKVSVMKLYFRQNIIPLIQDNTLAEQWFSWMIVFLQQSLRLQFHQKVVLKNFRSALLLLNDTVIDHDVLVTLTEATIHRLRLPVNVPLLLDQWLIRFTKGMRLL